MTCRLVQTSCGSAEEAERIAAALVGERLAACVQIVPVESLYRWQGNVERGPEWRLDIKTAMPFETVEARVLALHSYELPEVVWFPLEGSTEYLAWVAAESGT